VRQSCWARQSSKRDFLWKKDSHIGNCSSIGRKNVCKDAELALRIEQIGEYKIPDYRDDFVFMVALYDDEYWEYISKMGKLPETYNDMMYDYLIHPEHAHAREKSHAVLRDYDKWLESMGAYDRYGRLRCKTCLVLSDIRKY